MLEKNDKNDIIQKTETLLEKNEWKGIMTKEYLENQYFSMAKTLKEIASENNTHLGKISKLFRLYNIKTRTKREIVDLETKKFIGKKFGKLIVLGRTENKNRGTCWICRCECGNTRNFTKHHLLQNDAVSCGCKRRTKCGDIPGSYFGQLRNNAKRRGIVYDVSQEFLWKLFLKQNKRCVISGWEIFFGNKYLGTPTTASLDRIDSSIGYTEENVQWIHKDINSLKSNFQESEFFKLVDIIYEHRHKK